MGGFSKIVFLLGIAFSFLFFIAGTTPVFALVEGDGAAPACIPGLSVCSSSTSGPFECRPAIVYSCTNNLCGNDGGSIKQATRFDTCETITTSCSNGCTSSTSSFTRTTGGPFYKNFVEPLTTAGKYQICPASGNSWSQNRPAYQCASQCYPAPIAKDVKDDTLSPKNVLDNKRVKLPVNLGWENNVNEWAQANSNPKGECTVEAYRYEVSDTNTGRPVVSDVKPLASPSSKPVLNDVVGQCMLQPANNYQWRVRACRDYPTAQDCTKWSSPIAFFNTSLAPELLSPYDEDFEDKERAGAVTSPEKPLVVEWCPMHEIGPADVKSYKIQVTLVEDGKEQCHPSGTTGGDTCPSFLIAPVQTTTDTGRIIEKLEPKFQDIRGAFTKGTQYFWSVAACIFESGHECTSFSQKWSFEPVDFPIGKTELADPSHDPLGLQAVGFPVALKWTRPFGINSFQYEIVPLASGKTPRSPDTAKFFPQSNLYSPAELSLDAFYTWRVKACIDIGSKVCEDQWTGTWTFKTTGAPPTGLSERNQDEKGEAIIPARLTWKEVSGAASYRYEVARSSSFADIAARDKVDASPSEASVDYPKVHMNKDYWWRVKTCADREGNFCGQWSTPKQFHTFTLKNPTELLTPKDGGEFWTYQDAIEWESIQGAKAYYPKLVYRAITDSDPRCKGLEGTEILLSLTRTVIITPDLKCLGTYDLRMVSCLDIDCQEKSADAVSQWTFNYVQPAPSRFPGLVVCGALSDHPDTDFIERDKCELKHLFLLLHNLIAFALWKLSLIIVVLMAIATGAIMFFSFGGVDVLTKIRSIWKSVGIGLAILLFSWLFLNILLGLVGFNVNVFGNWYDLPIP